jgi:hypothetical protein
LAALGSVRRSRCGSWRCRDGSHGTALLDVLEVGNGAKQFAAMSERPNTNLFEVLIGQVT